MSRIFEFSGGGFFLGLLACAFLTTSALTAQETTVEHHAPAPPIPGFLAVSGQPFHSLLDDVTIKSEPYEDGYFSFVAQCQLNAPNDPAAANETDSDVSDETEWAALLTYGCDEKKCNGCSNLTFTNSPQSNQFRSCQSQPSEKDSEDYCEQVSQLLATILKGSPASFEAKSSAIETAMQMVAQKTLADNELRINELKMAHQKEIGQLQDQLLEAKGRKESLNQVMAWLRPIYDNQNRNYQQLQKLTAVKKNQLPPFRLPEIDNLERFVETSVPGSWMCGGEERGSSPRKLDRSLIPSSARMASKTLAENREAEIAKLKQELQRIDARLSKLLNQSAKRSVQTATHLQPVFVPEEQLVPILQTPERHSALRRLEPTQRLNRTR